MVIELLFKIGITITVLVVMFFEGVIVVKVWRSQIDTAATLGRLFDKIKPESGFIATIDPGKIYQVHKPVGDVDDAPSPQPDGNFVFKELANTGALDRTKPFQYRRQRSKIL